MRGGRRPDQTELWGTDSVVCVLFWGCRCAEAFVELLPCQPSDLWFADLLCCKVCTVQRTPFAFPVRYQCGVVFDADVNRVEVRGADWASFIAQSQNSVVARHWLPFELSMEWFTFRARTPPGLNSSVFCKRLWCVGDMFVLFIVRVWDGCLA